MIDSGPQKMGADAYRKRTGFDRKISESFDLKVDLIESL